MADILNKIQQTLQKSNQPIAFTAQKVQNKSDQDPNKSLITQPSSGEFKATNVAKLVSNALNAQSIIELPVTINVNGKKTPIYYNYNSGKLIYQTGDTTAKELTYEQIYNAKQTILKAIQPYTTGEKSFGILPKDMTKTLANNLYKSVNSYKKEELSSYEKSKNNGGSGSGGGGGTVVNYYNNNNGLDEEYKELIKDLRNRITELENPKVWTAEELAKQFNVEDSYNVDYWKNLYNTKTNKYYNDIIAEQNKVNDQNNTSNSNYAARLLNKYVDSYRNAAPTAMGRGTLAANALMQNLGATAINEEYATNLNNLVNDYKQQWNAELANNPTLARDTYNTIGQWLINRGVATNTAEVQNYINHLNAYDTAYSGIRNAQVNLAKTAADAYSNNAQAALAKNQAAANGAKDNALIEAYKLKYGTDTNNWAVALNNDNHDVAIKYGLTYNNK